jgi:AraC-like DNA-binding protein
MRFKLLPAPEHLKDDIECIRIAEHTGEDSLAIKVCLNGLPGIVFQHHNGNSPIENIVTRSGFVDDAPTLYVYGQMTEPSVMNHKQGPFTTIQIVLKPHALSTLLGINASVLTNELVGLTEFSAGDLNRRLLDATSEERRVTLLTDFLGRQLAREKTRDCLVEESLRLIHTHLGCITVKDLLDTLNISERQFERRFCQTVGVAPQFYIRIKRFNEAIRLMQTGQFENLTHVAYALNFYDQSHFIRDIKAFSGITPKHLSQRVDDGHMDQKVYSYL